MKKFSKSEAINFGWKTMKANFGFFLLLWVIVVAANLLPQAFVALSKDFVVVYALATFASVLISFVIQLGIIRIVLKLIDKHKPTYKDLFYYKPLINYFFSSIVYSVIVGIGFLLLIIPGIILSIKLQFYTYFIVDKNAGPIEALQKSWEVTKGVKWNLFLFWWLLVGINILGALALGVGLFATIPTTMVAIGYVYRKLATK